MYSQKIEKGFRIIKIDDDFPNAPELSEVALKFSEDVLTGLHHLTY